MPKKKTTPHKIVSVRDERARATANQAPDPDEKPKKPRSRKKK